ncbi:MAG TPA: transglutaminaseTgpA domain-containing protein [Pseudomonadales bacterium]|nr:transglutaminaseTgpA domain-containing protein [Pseudomonadales bacterium]
MSTGVLDQVPRSSLALLLVAQAAVILPHVPRLSPWVLGMWGICVLWRVFVYQGRWGYPSTLVKAGLILLGAVGVATSYGQLYGLEPATAMLIVAFALKLLEMKDRRDALVVIYLAYFVIGVEFLFDQGMTAAAYQLLAMLIVTGALVALHQSWSRPRLRSSLTTATVLLLQAVPLTVVMFLFFPRIAPLWSVPLPDANARMGLSESMTPGDIASLGRSEELAFRVEFEGAVPAQRTLYWRALTFSNYEDGTWSGGRIIAPPERLVHWQGMRREPDWLESIVRDGEPMRYAVTIEPTYRRWLFGLDLALPLSPGTGIGRDFRIVAADPVVSRMRYEIASYPGVRLDPQLPPWLQARETALPPTGNPRTRALVAELQASTASDADLLDALLARFRREAFFYTLSPPTLDGDEIDGFLFDTQRGFCAHYAGAFVYMARLAGIPARVVAGYQGGEPNPLANHLIVRQYDAHAWAEVWLEGSGWMRVDPTAAVAPNRIELGAEAALREGATAEGVSPFGGTGWRALPLLADLAYYIDSLDYRWNVFVLSYDATAQSAFLKDLLGEVTPTRIAFAVIIAGALAVGLSAVGFLVTALRTRRPPLFRLHDGLAAAFAAAGAPRAPHESPRAYGRRLVQHFPALAADVERIVAPLDRALFDPDGAGDVRLDDARLALWRLRLRLALGRLAGTFSGGRGREIGGGGAGDRR